MTLSQMSNISAFDPQLHCIIESFLSVSQIAQNKSGVQSTLDQAKPANTPVIGKFEMLRAAPRCVKTAWP